MIWSRPQARLEWLALPVLLVSLHCSGSTSPTSPGGTATISAVTFTATSVAAGAGLQGTVTLAAAAPAQGATVSLTSSNPAVATVAASVLVPAGASSATFAVTTLAAGTTTITASFNGASRQSAPLTVGAAIAVASISLSASTVVGGNIITGTVTLTAAPQSAAVVSLSAADPVTVAPTVTVAAGSISAPFTVQTRAVAATTAATVTASLGGVSMSAALAVTHPTVATASFGITGPTESETCTMANTGTTLNCTFDGSTSTAPGTIVAWDWSYTVAGTLTRTTAGPVLTLPSVTCAWLPPAPLPAGASSLTLVVKLVVHDNLGNVSAEAVHGGARLIPTGACGY